MCDPECRRRFHAIEIDVATIATDIRWMKRFVTGAVVVICSIYGIDVSGVV